MDRRTQRLDVRVTPSPPTPTTEATDMPEPITTPDTETISQVRLDAAIDATGGLTISHDEDLLDETASLSINCLDTQQLQLVIGDFTHEGQSWTVSATPRTRIFGVPSAWKRRGSDALDEGTGPTEDTAEVVVTAQNPAASAAPKEKTILIKIKVRKPLPTS